MNDIRLRTDGFVCIRVPVQSDHITQLESECNRLRERVKELEADKRRLDWLESVGFATIPATFDRPPDVHSWRIGNRSKWKWVARGIDSNFTTVRDAIDAALKELK